MNPAELSRTVRHAVCRAVHDGALRVTVPERVTIERPRAGGTGDWSTNAALALAGPAGRSPHEVAEIIRALVDGTEGIESVDITGPGFLNFTLAEESGARLVRTVLRHGDRYGHGDALSGTRAVFAQATEVRARIWTEVVVLLLRTQGAAADIGPGGSERPAVVPAPGGADLFSRLGSDAARWSLLRPAAHDRPYTGAGLLVQRESNPLFLVRYAYARTRALARAAARLGVAPGYGRRPGGAAEDGSSSLLAALGDHPAVLESAARLRAPDRLARHLERTAETFLRFQQTSRPLPLGDEKPAAAHSSRVALAEAAGVVLAGGLSLLGITAPEHL